VGRAVIPSTVVTAATTVVGDFTVGATLFIRDHLDVGRNADRTIRQEQRDAIGEGIFVALRHSTLAIVHP
jgi:hypothetical protein